MNRRTLAFLKKKRNEKIPKELCQERARRVTDAIQLKVPYGVPLEIAVGYFPAKYIGIPCEAAYYDYDQWLAACKKTVLDFGADITVYNPSSLERS